MIILFIYLFISKTNKNKNQSGSSYKLMYDLKNSNYANFYEKQPDVLNNIITKRNNNDIEFLKYVCKYINTLEIETNENDKSIIVGDVHGSMFQLFIPLKQANILKSIDLDSNLNFIYTLNTDYENFKQVIYCGDFVGRSKHPLVVEMLITFLKILDNANKFKTDTIIWVFGNHDIGFIKHFINDYKYKYKYDYENNKIIEIHNEYLSKDVYDSELNDIKNSNNLGILKDLLKNYVDNNKYPCIYYSENNNFIVSHTFMIYSYDLIAPRSDYIFIGLNALYSLLNNFENLTENIIYLNIFITNFYNLHNEIMSIIKKYPNDYNIHICNRLSTIDDKYNEFIKNCINKIFILNETKFEKLNIKTQIDFINNIAKQFVIKNNYEFYYKIETELYWLTYILPTKDSVYRANNFNIINESTAFKNSNIIHFVGHEAQPIINNYISRNIDIKNINIDNINNIIMNEIHKTFIKTLIEKLKLNAKSSNYEYNKGIINENIIHAKIIQDLMNRNLYILGNKLEKSYNKTTGCYDLDITATSGIVDIFYIRYLFKAQNDILDYDDFVVSIEIGFNLCSFAIINNKNEFRCSKLYLF